MIADLESQLSALRHKQTAPDHHTPHAQVIAVFLTTFGNKHIVLLRRCWDAGRQAAARNRIPNGSERLTVSASVVSFRGCSHGLICCCAHGNCLGCCNATCVFCCSRQKHLQNSFRSQQGQSAETGPCLVFLPRALDCADCNVDAHFRRVGCLPSLVRLCRRAYQGSVSTRRNLSAVKGSCQKPRK
jgi:hypothetical protein